MAHRCVYWIKNDDLGDCSWSNAANWSLSATGTGGVAPPDSDDTAIFTGICNGQCIVTSAISVASINVSDYGGFHTGIIDFADYDVTVEHQVVVKMSGAFPFKNLAGVWTCGVLALLNIDGLNLAPVEPDSIWNVTLTGTNSVTLCVGSLYSSTAQYCRISKLQVSVPFNTMYCVDSGDTVNVVYGPASISSGISVVITGTVSPETSSEDSGLSTLIIGGGTILVGLTTTSYTSSGSCDAEISCGGTITVGLRGSIDVVPIAGQSYLGGNYTGAVMPLTDTSKFQLWIDGNLISISSNTITLEQLSISYQTKELTFSEKCPLGVGYGDWTYFPEQPVELKMNFGSGMQTYFRGRIKKVTPSGTNNQEKVSYFALGWQGCASEVDIQNADGYPEEYFSENEAVVSCMRQLFANNGPNLGPYAIPLTEGVPDADMLTSFLEKDVTLSNASFIDACRQIMQDEPSIRLFWDDVTSTWQFIKLTDAPAYNLEIDLARLDSHTYTVDTSNRYAAITLHAYRPATLIASGKGVVACTQGWDDDIQADWTIAKGAGLGVPANFGAAYNWVFRRWIIEEMPEGAVPLGIYALVPFWDSTTWVPLQTTFNPNTLEVFTNVPIVISGNPHVSGDCKGPLAVGFVYGSHQAIGGIVLDSQRIPETGYTGTANSWFGITAEKQLMVSNENFNFEYADSSLSLLKDVIVNADIPLIGDPIEAFLRLNANIQLNDSSRGTGIDGIDAFLIKYTYRFGSPGMNTLTVNNDRSNVVRVKG